MKMELNNNGYWEINRGKTKIVVYPGPYSHRLLQRLKSY